MQLNGRIKYSIQGELLHQKNNELEPTPANSQDEFKSKRWSIIQHYSTWLQKYFPHTIMNSCTSQITYHLLELLIFSHCTTRCKSSPESYVPNGMNKVNSGRHHTMHRIKTTQICLYLVQPTRKSSLLAKQGQRKKCICSESRFFIRT